MEVCRKLASKTLTIFAKDSMIGQIPVVFYRGELLKIRTKALRQGVWFRVLSRAERVYMELAMNVVDRVRSRLVTKLLTSIVGKLLEATRSKVARMIEEIGQASARKLSRIAQNWGNESASRWVDSREFIQYLAITYMNTPTTFQVVP